MIDILADANVVLKWFHGEGEEEVRPARVLLSAYQARTVGLAVLDLTPYEVGNALLRGPAKASAEQTATVLTALGEICPVISPDTEEMRTAADIAHRHGLTLYDAAYAAVAQSRGATLVTLDKEIRRAGLGKRPSELVALLDA